MRSNYIVKNRLGIYYLRYALPTATPRARRKEIRASLRTRDPQLAILRANPLIGAIEAQKAKRRDSMIEKRFVGFGIRKIKIGG
jgi:hypothetical protein